MKGEVGILYNVEANSFLFRPSGLQCWRHLNFFQSRGDEEDEDTGAAIK